MKLETAPGRTPIHVSPAGTGVVTVFRRVGNRSAKIAFSGEEALLVADALVDSVELMTAKLAKAGTSE